MTCIKLPGWLWVRLFLSFPWNKKPRTSVFLFLGKSGDLHLSFPKKHTGPQAPSDRRGSKHMETGESIWKSEASGGAPQRESPRPAPPAKEVRICRSSLMGSPMGNMGTLASPAGPRVTSPRPCGIRVLHPDHTSDPPGQDWQTALWFSTPSPETGQAVLPQDCPPRVAWTTAKGVYAPRSQGGSIFHGCSVQPLILNLCYFCWLEKQPLRPSLTQREENWIKMWGVWGISRGLLLINHSCGVSLIHSGPQFLHL